SESYTMTDTGDGRDTSIPKKKADTYLNGGQFFVDFLSGGAAAAIAKTAFVPIEGNLSSVIRYAPSMALSIALKEQFKNYFLDGVDKNESFIRFANGNFMSGALAGAASLSVALQLDVAFARRSKLVEEVLRKQRMSVYRKRLVGRSITTIQAQKVFGGYIRLVPGVFISSGFYFGLYDTLKVTSDGHKLNFAFAWALALATSVFANGYHAMGQIIDKADELAGESKTPRNRGMGAKYSEADIRKAFSEFGAKRFAVRCATGALVLAGYDEIQKWLH
ncbi:hypothetical protein PMAYCL1PPCAC_20599, partial [Pristionchus mayeri]